MYPYKIIAEDDESITYQYNSMYSWTMIAILVVILTGMGLENMNIQLFGAILIFAYFAAKLTLGKEITRRVTTAVKSHTVQISGGKYSLKQPLTIKIPKNA